MFFIIYMSGLQSTVPRQRMMSYKDCVYICLFMIKINNYFKIFTESLIIQLTQLVCNMFYLI